MNKRKAFALRQWIATALLSAITLSPIMVSAETHGQALERMCPNGASIKDFERRIHEADAMQDSIRYQLRYDEAREFFRCSKTVTNPYIVDSATFLYAIDLAQSARTNVEADERGHTAASAFNELAASTRFDDLRKLAIDLRDSTRKYADEAHNAIYGSSDPSSSPATEVPTDTPTP